MVAFSPLQFHCICQRLVLPIGKRVWLFIDLNGHKSPTFFLLTYLPESEQQSVKQEFGHLLDFLQQLRKVKVSHTHGV